jgi:hypothetical protein
VYFSPGERDWKAYEQHFYRIDQFDRDMKNEVTTYLFKPPIDQVRYLMWCPELSWGNPQGKGYFSQTTTIGDLGSDLFTNGVASSLMKQWLLYG